MYLHILTKVKGFVILQYVTDKPAGKP